MSKNSQAKSNGNSVSVELVRGKECKGSVRFETEDNLAAVTNVYLSRLVPFAGTASKIRVTIEICGA